MIVVADSGSTKTDWRVLFPSGEVLCFESKGLNPYFNPSHEYVKALSSNFPQAVNPSHVTHVFFYGAGCAAEELGAVARQGLSLFFCCAEVLVLSDSIGAARSLFADSEGISIILGTGTNVAYYNGKSVVSYSPSLGYVLGDEASGASMGRVVLTDYFYKRMPESLSVALENGYGITLTSVLKRIYSEPLPNQFLASFVPFLVENRESEYVQQLVATAFSALYYAHLAHYASMGLPYGIVGSVGCLFAQEFMSLATEKGFAVGPIVRYPINNLLAYHSGK
ncbi:MAG: hypothetical protein JW783_04265 [Bacteroidales bacterium]|nr:hypothetical protein [Bacteroidales bacterium]MBN2750173.1 hypothetical protein [Bacteroidales bacterium]